MREWAVRPALRVGEAYGDDGPPTLAAAIAAAVRGVPVLGASAALRICDPPVPASPADRYGKEVAETENKAKKKLVSRRNGDFNVTRA
jgi:hypothetical protein